MDGVPAAELSDDLLRHELRQLKIKQADIEADGTPAQQANHAARTSELEEEFLRRFPSGRPANGDGEESTGPQPGIHPGAGDPAAE